MNQSPHLMHKYLLTRCEWHSWGTIDNEIKEGKMENSATGTEQKGEFSHWEHQGSSSPISGKNGDVLLEVAVQPGKTKPCRVDFNQNNKKVI